MLYCHLAQARSLVEICGGLATVTGKLPHLGIKQAPKKSTLAYANGHRPWEPFRDLCLSLRDRCAAIGTWNRSKKIRFKNKLFSIDSTMIDLCVEMFPWAKYVRTKGAVKIHLVLDHDGYLPCFAHITDGKTSDVRAARDVIQKDMAFPVDSVVVFDRGYTDFDMFARWDQLGVWFVTRLKDNVLYDVLKKNEIKDGGVIRSDEMIILSSQKAFKTPLPDLRRIVVYDEANDKEIVLLTNHQGFAASTIASIYRERWQIEIFFKTIKQHLRVKTFVGTTANAIAIQIWTALCAIILLKYLKMLSTFGWSLSNLIALLRPNLFTYRTLQTWLDNPYEAPPLEPEGEQLALAI
jgi:hypothetical protein